MADINFFATDEDLDALWGMIFTELGLTAFPDPWFGELPSPALKTRADVAEQLATYPRVAPGLGYFLVSPAWMIEPLEYHLCDNNPNFSPHWYVRPRYGGPSIQFIPRFGYPWHQEPAAIISGMFSDYPFYYSAVDHQLIIEKPAGFVATMTAIRPRLRSLGKPVRAASGQRAIVMNKALAEHDHGRILRAGNIIYTPLKSQRRKAGD